MSLFTDLLNYYNFTEKDYAAFRELGSIDDIPNPFEKIAFFAEMIDFIKKSIKAKKRFVIYGDYDVDGITSTTILVYTLRKLGADVGFFIPSRYKEGYGLNAKRIIEFAEKHYDVLIAVDNGITKVEEVKLASSRGLETIIIDHHQAQKEIPQAKYIFQQFIADYTDYNISAAFLALLVSFGLLGEYEHYLVTLAGIAVISDLMPLKKANIALVRMAMSNILSYRYFNLLSLVSPKSNLDINILAYEIIPILNSPGRIKAGLEVNDAVKLLLSDDENVIRILADRFIKYNSERKDMVASGFDEASIDFKQEIVLYKSNLPAGISGLLAGRILPLVNKPVVVYAQDPVSLNYVASIRSPKNYNIVNSLTNFQDYFVDFGGHATAAGFTVKEDKINIFLQELPKYLLPLSAPCEEQKTIFLDLYKFNIDEYKYIESFEPFGVDHEEPLFIIEVEAEKFVPSTKNPIHMFLNIDRHLKICFFSGRDKIPASGKIRLTGHLRKNSFYKTGLYCDFIVEDLYKSC